VAPVSSLSERNVQNSVASFLASKLITAGYLVYWHQIDSVETPDGVYPNYSTLQSTYLAIPGFMARVNLSKGLVTLTGNLSALPRFVTRPTSDGKVEGHDTVPTPALSVTVGPMVSDGDFELGSKLRWRSRHLMVQGFLRNDAEQQTFADVLAEWFDDHTIVEIRDHVAGSLALLDTFDLVAPRVAKDTDVDGAEAVTYEVLVNARLEYVA
jgi:hypothetical protein